MTVQEVTSMSIMTATSLPQIGSDDVLAPGPPEITPVELLFSDEEGSLTPKRQNLASTAIGAKPSYMLEYLSLSLSELGADHTVIKQEPQPTKNPVETVSAPTASPQPVSPDNPTPVPRPITKQAALAPETTSSRRRPPSAAVARKLAQLQVQRERQRRAETELRPVRKGRSPSEINQAELDTSKIAASPVSPHPQRSAVNFLADPNVEVNENLLVMPGLDDEDLTTCSTTKLAYKKSNSILFMGEDDTIKQHLQCASIPNILNARPQTMVNDVEKIAEAQKSLESLSPQALDELIKTLCSEKGKTSTNMAELMDNSPPGCFIVESDPGLYHLLEPKALAMFLAKSRTSKRTHVVGNVTIHKEEAIAPAGKTLKELAGKQAKIERVIYEV